MSNQPELIHADGPSAALPTISRGDFIKATYSHLAIAVLEGCHGWVSSLNTYPAAPLSRNRNNSD
jgi:hypothetical protein